MKKLIKIKDLSKEEIIKILDLAKDIESEPSKYSDKLKDKVLANVFLEPSTRTRVGFSVAMQKLGGSVVDLLETKFKEGMGSPESFEDTFRVMSDYSDILTLRHPSENLVNEIQTDNVLINCGNGKDEHPTQTLIDLYAMKKEFGNIENLSIEIVGDLKNMRSAHSLVLALSYFNNIKITLTSPTELKLPEKYLENNDLDLSEIENISLSNTDIIYIAGFPPNKLVSEDKRLSYQLNSSKINQLKESSIILCPLPRVDEISKEVDKIKQAKYFEQSKNGLFVRMAILLNSFI
jgi:aspartate carbamoyltransferase catalytic subunit